MYKPSSRSKWGRPFFAFFLSTLAGGWLVYFSLQTPLPSQVNPLIFYSNQSRSDLRLTLKHALEKSTHSIDLKIYALTDPTLLKTLEKQAKKGNSVTIACDHKATPSLTHLPFTLKRIKAKGLMHQKIALIDNHTTFLGSANFTTSSLVLHDNLSVGIYHPGLVQFLKENETGSFAFSLAKEEGEIFLLPDKEEKALLKILNTLHSAKKEIFLSMFTLTHPAILQALAEAKGRGVKVIVALDFFTARGASLKAEKLLKGAGCAVYISSGNQLFHHKWAFIDQEKLILGSTNWTKAAFKKNHDILLFLSNLPKEQTSYLQKLCQTILSECTSGAPSV